MNQMKFKNVTVTVLRLVPFLEFENLRVFNFVLKCTLGTRIEVRHELLPTHFRNRSPPPMRLEHVSNVCHGYRCSQSCRRSDRERVLLGAVVGR